MNLLFVHQACPGQYLHLLSALSRGGGHRLCALGMAPRNPNLPEALTYVRYGAKRGNGADVHPLAKETESKVLRGEACAEAAHRLKQQGFSPDLICAHPGWGKALFLKAIWPEVPLLTYQEFFYRPSGTDSDFDSEFKEESGWRDEAKLRMKNGSLLLQLEASDWGISPTRFQHSTFPPHWQQRISVIHDGIRCDLAKPNPQVEPLSLRDGTVVTRGEPVVTFINRSLEPYRGIHTMLRAVPELQRLAPEAHVVVVGKEDGVSYGSACPQGEWKERFLAEIEGQYDPARLHFTGPLPYGQLLQLLQISAVHIYLTYPFVLSWSLLEAMSCGCAVVGSDTAPVREVIQHGHTGLLVDFFSPNDLAAATAELLTNREHAERMGSAARELIVKNYRLETCLAHQFALMQLVAAKRLTL